MTFHSRGIFGAVRSPLFQLEESKTTTTDEFCCVGASRIAASNEARPSSHQLDCWSCKEKVEGEGRKPLRAAFAVALAVAVAVAVALAAALRMSDGLS